MDLSTKTNALIEKNEEVRVTCENNDWEAPEIARLDLSELTQDGLIPSLTTLATTFTS